MAKNLIYAFLYVSYFATAVALIGAVGVLLPERRNTRKIGVVVLASGFAVGVAALIGALWIGSFVYL
jgi:hypothetical protein